VFIDFANEEETLVYRVQNTASTLADVSRAFANLLAYAVEQIPFEDDNQRKKAPILFHRDCFQYYLTIQLCKLFEPAKRKSQANSSLYKLNEVLYEKYPTKHNKYRQVKNELESFQASEICKHLRMLRDKTYAHSDVHDLNTPLKFFRLTPHQIEEIRLLIIQLELLYNSCVMVYDKEFTFHNFYKDTTPKNYLNYNFRARAFFRKFSSLVKLREVASQLNTVKSSLNSISDPMIKEHALLNIFLIESFIREMVESSLEKSNGLKPGL
jgi:hypothetical protein